MSKTAAELEKKMARWAKAQAKNHPMLAPHVAREAAQRTLLPCDCSLCHQPRLSQEEAELVERQQAAVAQHQASWDSEALS